MNSSSSFLARFWLAFLLFFRILFDPEFARRALALRAASTGPEHDEVQKGSEALAPRTDASLPTPDPVGPALQLLGILQREGRLVDFLEQDVESFSDEDIGAAARVVHDGCRTALRKYVEVQSVRTEDEGSRVHVESKFDAERLKLTGNVEGSGPFEGVLRHRGWIATSIHLPQMVAGHNANVIAPAEVEL